MIDGNLAVTHLLISGSGSRVSYGPKVAHLRSLENIRDLAVALPFLTANLTATGLDKRGLSVLMRIAD